MNEIVKDFEIIKDFLIETREGLSQVDLDLVALEKDPRNAETLARVFRTIHTIKGTAGFLGLTRLEAVAHAAEGLLSRLRDGQLALTTEMISALLRLADAVREVLASLEATQEEGSADYTDLIRTLQLLQQGGRTSDPTPAAPAQAPPKVESPLRAGADSTIRVDLALLDRLMNLMGELVLARNQIVQLSAAQNDSAFLTSSQHLSLITSELQEGVMRTRLQPVANLWRKLPRFVRDLALECGKQVRLEMEGGATELDKSILEAIADPLIHLVRNAIDHGLESPVDRRSRGKPAEGRLALSAYHEGGKVHIALTDDGAGIDTQRLKARAAEAQWLSPEQAAHLDDHEALELIFRPGFSTAERLTRVSGRGVGMDVVRTNVEKIGGTVEVHTQLGRGTTVQLKIPLTLAIIPALTVTSGGERYAIPQASLLELVHLESDRAARAIEQVHDAAVYRLRGHLLPLVFLSRVLDLEGAEPGQEGAINLVVLQADDRQFGLVVDTVHDTEEIVVKPLQKPLKGIGVFAGATILGDGKVVLILDVVGLAQQAGVLAGGRAALRTEKPAAAPASKAAVQSLLLFATAHDRRLVIPLSEVARLEEFPRAAIERAGSREVVQYRGDILPLVNVSQVLAGMQARSGNGRPAGRRRKTGPPASANEDTVPVVVYSSAGRHVGLVVGRILDIVEDALAVRSPATRAGVVFSTVIQGRVTELLDVESILRAAGLRSPASGGCQLPDIPASRGL
ncbi:MAG: chemotaxis protein CheW [Planctomycetes bacterium]|nr:chemotaxis protein CheW [Planctomycetota bacterium]